MKNKDIEASLKRALNQAPELDLEKLLNTPVARMTEHDSVTAQQGIPDTLQDLFKERQLPKNEIA